MLCLGLSNASCANTPTTDAKILHLINRLSFGPSPGDLEKVKSMGVDPYIQQQLSPQSIPESWSVNQRLQSLSTLNLTPVELLVKYQKQPQPRPRPLNVTQRQTRGRNPQVSPTPQIVETPQRMQPPSSPQKPVKSQVGGRLILTQAVEARLVRGIESPRQLQEVMVDFWYNHFNVFAGKDLTPFWVGAYEQEGIRPHVFGRFRDLLEATARHPAMLVYLDNWLNTDPNSPGSKGKFKGLNENYARELMELHTLGVNGGYTQQDVIVLARIFTGWGFSHPSRLNPAGYNFAFDSQRHDSSAKIFLGKTIAPGGIEQAEKALDILARSPATANHISYKLAQYFVADQPPPSLVKKLSRRFLETDGNIRAVLETLFRSEEFNDPKYYNAKFKTPYEYIISAYRATGIPVKNTGSVLMTLRQMGMPLYGCLTPDGYKNTQEAWLSPDGMTKRLNFATMLSKGNNDKKNTNQDMVNPDQLAATLGNRFSSKTQQAIASNPKNLKAAIILGSPEFMYH
ncbi:hypothetical protein AsFPU1_3393 [Aphanothece sacrum FPU1]|uniref:DUF1800 domain-containing protein n=1 Tax=Aphanothece sacrum FPU1 TaxID=1920663 RepID=A0A401IL41_APHSA|nr:hypothetical protein AsFPU1_3393 [Aphanothece sacrum FPU1]GBF83599.1 hypothetical protein AsFPU3_0642 [Aphanothece sacrum FPU3]